MRALAKKPNERYSSAEDFRAAISAVAARLRPSEPASSTPRVLVVDDDADFRTFVCSYVRRLSPDAFLYTAQDGAEALDVARRVQPHLAVLDLNMPEMNGLELLQRRRAERLHPHIPIVLVTTEGTDEDEMRGREAGAWDYLKKPFQPADVERIVARALSESRAASA
jgi:DNA-binding response OmpR family regulator